MSSQSSIFAPEVPSESQLPAFRRRLLALVVLYSLAVAALPHVLDEPAIRLALRLQARLSFGLFVAALAGPGLERLLPSRASHTLARERSSLIVAFGLSHLIHGVWIVLFFLFTPHVFSWNLVDTSGLVAFPLIALLVFAELAVGRRLLGAGVRYVERAVLAYAWVQFFGFFVMRTQTGSPSLLGWYVVALILSLAAAALAWVGAAGSSATGARAGEC
jgi:hypothetical protein